jgi:hypothetical protein
VLVGNVTGKVRRVKQFQEITLTKLGNVKKQLMQEIILILKELYSEKMFFFLTGLLALTSNGRR